MNLKEVLIKKFNIPNVSILFFILINLILIKLPLTKFISYEYFAINGLLIALFTGIIFLFAFNVHGIELGKIKIFLPIHIVFVLLIPILIALFVNIFSPICSLKEAVIFYSIFSVPAIVVGFGLAQISDYFSHRFKYLVFVVSFLFLLILPVFDFYFFPHVYFYNSLITYFPGTIYDEAVKVNYSIILYRVFISAVFIILAKSIIYLKQKMASILQKLCVAITIIVLIICSYMVYPYFGWLTTDSVISQTLTKKISTSNFEIHLSPEIDDQEAEYIKLLHENYYDDLSTFFNVKVDGKITSYVFADNIEKGKFIGSENADIAKPWLKQIYITLSSYEGTLKHELAHIFSGEFGAIPFKVHKYLNFAIIEGIAMAAEGDYGDYDLISMAASSVGGKYYMSPAELFDNSAFFTSPSSIGYVHSGAFISFLINEFRIEKIKKLYSGETFESIYRLESSFIEEKYKLYLLESQTESISSHTLQYYFGRASIFMKHCPRFVANKIKESNSYIEKKQFREALNNFESLSKITNSPSVLLGRISMLQELGLIDSALSIVKNETKNFQESGIYYSILLKNADLFFLVGKTKDAISLYDSLINFKPHPYFQAISLTRKLLIENNQLDKFLRSDSDEKFGILYSMNKAKIQPETLLLLLTFSRRHPEQVNEVINELLISLEKDEISSTFLSDSKLSELTLKNAAKFCFRRGEVEKGNEFLKYCNRQSSSAGEIRND